MNRLIRISLTLFLSATVLVVLVLLRANKLQTAIDAGLAEQAAREETRMIVVGIILAGALAIGGFALVITAIVKSRKAAPSRHE
jgi:hypothetical protein